jgi:single-stranded-DNA-specific exonuclease
MTNNNLGKSVLGFNWQQKSFDNRLALTIFQKVGVSEVLSKLLAMQNVALDEVENFLNPTIKSTLPDPFLLLDMDLAAAKIVDAIKNQRKIVIFGDYDVDGATSSALLKRFFRMVGLEAKIYIPDRILEGYGPNVNALLKLRQEGADLVITVDCGTTAFAPLEAANKAGLEMIVIDHHLGALEKPQAIAVINPNRLDENFEHKNLAAVGVCFLLVVAVNKVLRQEGFYVQNNLSEPKLLSLLDLVALGTVCDVVALTNVNRAYVSQGLKIMKNRENVGLRTLCDVAGISEEPSAYHLGFVVGPRINAGGRVGKSNLGAELLSCDDEDEAKKVADILNAHNLQRKDIEKNVLEEALKQIEKNKLDNHPVIFVAQEGWHPGVIGIVASRIKEAYNKPTAIIAINEGIGKASCRSIYGVDFGSSIIKAKLNGLLMEGGGHAMAAGFSVDYKKIKDLHEYLCADLKEIVDVHCQIKVKEFADILDLTSANLALAKEIAALEPYGSGNSRPKFLIKDLSIIKADFIGSDKKHVRCIFGSKNLSGWQGGLVGVAFGAAENNVGQALMNNRSKNVSVIGQLNINNWMGNQAPQVIIEDVVLSG